jgi:hypothetical protein
MKYALSTLSVVPVRTGANHKSEQLTQILFGEAVEILDRIGKQWSKVHCLWDDTIGWVDSRQLLPITEKEFLLAREFYAVNLDLLHPVATGASFVPVPLGARLPQFDGIQFRINEEIFTFSGQAVDPEALPSTAEMLIRIARKYLHAPHQKGGRNPLGIDAPGLIQNVFNILGIQLPRTCEEQVLTGDAVDFVEQARPGDLAFFENRKGTIHHVGLILPDHEILHVAGQVQIDLLDHYGIFDRHTRNYSHKLRVIRRLPLQEAESTKRPSREEVEDLNTASLGHPELFSAAGEA